MTKLTFVPLRKSLAALLALLAPALITRADIFQWEYIDPGNHGQGKQESAILCPGGAGANAMPGANLSFRNLTQAYLVGALLTPYYATDEEGNILYTINANLASANLSQADLTNAQFGAATLSGANFSGAEVRGAKFGHNYFNPGSGLTPSQLYLTASYVAHDLTGIDLTANDFTGGDFAGQNLTNAHLFAKLTNADFSNANLTNADFASHTFDFANLSGANLSGANLANANFSGFDDPEFGYVPGSNLTNANLSRADARGALFQFATLTGANTNNLIQSNGHIAGLGLTAGALLVVRDYDGNAAVSPPIGHFPIVVDAHLAMDAASTMRLQFDADAWNSTISFAPGIAVSRGGTLELTFASDVDVASQLGRTIDLFDWTNVVPTGAFNVTSPYTWDLSKIYTTGEVTLTSLAGVVSGDFNGNGNVDAADYVVWRKINGPAAGYELWRSHFGQPPGSGATSSASTIVPEPTTSVMLILVVLSMVMNRRHIE